MGGDGPDNGEKGFDCSGLANAAYAAGITLPARPTRSTEPAPNSPPAPGSPRRLVYYGNPNTCITHVALYIGGGRVIEAPTFGQSVHIGQLRDYVGVTCPVPPEQRL